MLQDEHGLFNQFVLLWVVIEPIGVVTIFVGVTAGLAPELKRGVAVKAVIVSYAVILFFIVGGQILLEALGVDLVSFQVAGGLVLFLFALQMILGTSDSPNEAEASGPDRPASELAIFPMAIPTIAGPGTMLAVVLLTDNARFSLMEQAETAAVAGVVLLITFGLLMLAPAVHRVIGTSGASVITRVMGLILAAIAVNNALQSVSLYFHIGQ